MRTNQKISPAIAERIRCLYIDGKSYDAIAKETGIIRNTVASYVARHGFFGARRTVTRRSDMICPICGNRSEGKRNRFCHYCGKKLTNDREDILMLITKEIQEPLFAASYPERDRMLSAVLAVMSYIEKTPLSMEACSQ
ncbi:MAG: hypothetical protein E7618_07045 [Ruminococcaceae bacterium]|nr:hypothetical protein [Oscillospiraceae bacterium]